MKGAGWQDAVVAFIAAGALAWLVVRRLRARRQDAACEGCPVAARTPGTRPAPVPEVLLVIGEPSHRADPREDAERKRGT